MLNQNGEQWRALVGGQLGPLPSICRGSRAFRAGSSQSHHLKRHDFVDRLPSDLPFWAAVVALSNCSRAVGLRNANQNCLVVGQSLIGRLDAKGCLRAPVQFERGPGDAGDPNLNPRTQTGRAPVPAPHRPQPLS